MYAIGKQHRTYDYNGDDTVPAPPWDRNEMRDDRERYVELVTSTYDTIEAANQACIEAKKYNPVGFKVLRIVPRLPPLELEMRTMIGKLAMMLDIAVVSLSKHDENLPLIENLNFREAIEDAGKMLKRTYRKST